VMRLSTGLNENDLHPRNRNLNEYIEWNQSFIHSTLSSQEVQHHSTVIHNYHHPVVEEVAVARQVPYVPENALAEELYTDSLQVIVNAAGMGIDELLPEEDESLERYIESIASVTEEEHDLSLESVTYHATNVYNWHNRHQEIPAIDAVMTPFMPEIELG